MGRGRTATDCGIRSKSTTIGRHCRNLYGWCVGVWCRNQGVNSSRRLWLLLGSFPCPAVHTSVPILSGYYTGLHDRWNTPGWRLPLREDQQILLHRACPRKWIFPLGRRGQARAQLAPPTPTPALPRPQRRLTWEVEGTSAGEVGLVDLDRV